MAIPSDKQSLLEAMQLGYTKLYKELSGITETAADARNMEGHAKDTLMSVKELVAYLLGWGLLVLKWNDKMGKGEPVDFPETGYKWNELGSLAQKFYKESEHDSYENVLTALDNTFNQLLKLVEGKSNAELYGTPWYTHYTLGRMIQLNTVSPYKNALLRTRKWKKQQQSNPYATT